MQSGADSRGFSDLGARIADTLYKLRRAASVEVGCSAKRAVWSCGKTTLYRYLPLAGSERRGARRRSTRVRFSSASHSSIGPTFSTCSRTARWYDGCWRQATPCISSTGAMRARASAAWIWRTICERHLAGCVAHVLQAHGLPALDLLGVCQGGVLSLCYTALHPQQIANLVTLTTPVDFHTPDNLLSKWVRGLDVDLVCGERQRARRGTERTVPVAHANAPGAAEVRASARQRRR